MSDNILDYEINLIKAKTNEDFSQLVFKHNQNIKEIEKWLSGLKSIIENLEGEGVDLSNISFENIMMQNRTIIEVNEDLSESDEIIVNDYKLIRINNPINFPSGSSELSIVDQNEERNTNFKKKNISVMDINENHVYPLIKTTQTKASVFFNDGGSLNSSQNSSSNKKYILIS